MIKNFVSFAVACLVITLNLSAASPSKPVYVRCGKLIFDTEKPAIEHGVLIITDGVLTSVGEEKEIAAPEGAEQVDLSRYTVLPGLIDAHIHLWAGPEESLEPSNALAALRAAKAMSYALASGVAGARVLGVDGFVDVALRDGIEERTIPGPHLIPGGHAISIPGGHNDFYAMPPEFSLSDYYTPLNGFVNCPADVEKAVHLQIKYGAGVIKVMASGGIVSPLDSPQAQQLTLEELRTAVEQAHMAQAKVAAHAENLNSLLNAVHAGVDSIEHGSEMSREAADFMKSHGIVLVPTLFKIESRLAGEGTEFRLRKARELAKTHFQSFQLALREGVLIAAGSDKTYEPGTWTVRQEMIALVKYGMTPQQALTAGTKNSAELLGLRQLGTLEVGKEGDLIAVEGDPLRDIHALEKIRVVIFQGKFVMPANMQ